MKNNLFDFANYKTYLSEKITHEASLDRSYRKKLVEHVGIQPSYLSQILNGKPDFTLEQAYRLNHYLLHDKVESRYFILLVEKSRAGTSELKQFFYEQLDEIRALRFNLKKRLKETDDISQEDKHKYYSAWFYSATYVILSIPHFQSIKSIALRFNLPEELIAEVISFLESCGLIEKKGGIYHVTKKRIHLDRESTFIQRHHINWRSQALLSTEKNLASDLHFSSVAALSVTDFEKIKEIFFKAIADAREVIRSSPEEDIIVVALDVFKL
jgi:uncharacterized protein (TIGR02147 family)